MDLLAGLALAVQADGLDLDDVVRLLLQVPQDAGAAGGVDFTDEALRVTFLSLGSDRTTRVLLTHTLLCCFSLKSQEPSLQPTLDYVFTACSSENCDNDDDGFFF